MQVSFVWYEQLQGLVGTHLSRFDLKEKPMCGWLHAETGAQSIWINNTRESHEQPVVLQPAQVASSTC